MRGHSCLCVMEDSYISADSDTCFARQVERLTSFQKNGNPYCTVERREEKAASVDRKELCRNPAKVLCDPKTNSEITDYQLFEATYLEHRFRVSQQQERELKLATGKSYCWELEGEEAEKCLTAQQLAFDSTVYNRNSMTTAANSFKRVKKLAVGYLKAKMATLEGSDSIDSKALVSSLKTAVERVEKAEFIFNQNAGVGGAASFNGDAPTCAVHGLIHAPLSSQDQTEFILAHEIAHLIDGTVDVKAWKPGVLFDYKPEQNPFRRLLDCEVKKGSVQAADVQCLQRAANEEGNKAASFTVEAIGRHPFRMHFGLKNGEKLCANNQFMETHGDVFATEVMAGQFEKKIKSGADPVHLLQMMTGSLCSSYIEEMATGMSEEEKNAATHPSFEKRINSILFGNPRIRAAVGCEPPREGAYCEI